MKTIVINIADDLHKALRTHAFNMNVTLRALCEGILDDGVRTRKPKDLAALAAGKLVRLGRPPIEQPKEDKQAGKGEPKWMEKLRKGSL